MKLSRINNLLFAAIILINSYIVIWPFVPGWLYSFQNHDKSHSQQLQAEIQTPVSAATAIPTSNELIIPSMLLDQPVFEGPTISTLEKGLWRIPTSSTPDKGSNTVIVGHRFTYTSPRGVLYNLDKVHVGDSVGLWWNKKLYNYTVTTTEVTGPDDSNVEAPSTTPELTIYTCTPLWLPRNRLIIIATLDSGQ